MRQLARKDVATASADVAREKGLRQQSAVFSDELRGRGRSARSVPAGAINERIAPEIHRGEACARVVTPSARTVIPYLSRMTSRIEG